MAMVLVGALTISLASYLIDRAMDRQFVSFVEETQQQANKQVVDAVRELYGLRGEKGNIEAQLRLLGTAGNVEIVVNPSEDHHPLMGRGMMGRGSMGMARRTTSELIMADGTAAIIEVIPDIGLEQADREASFRKAVNGSIVVAAFLSLTGALLISILFSWRLTKPLQDLTHMVRRVGQGELAERVELTGNDELTYLGQEFNQMAINLESQEQLRVKLTNDMAHELRTPLTTIQAYLEAMGDGVVEASGENLALILGEAQRLGELLKRLQELAKLEKPRMERKSVDVAEVLSVLVGSLRILAEDKRLTLRWDQPEVALEILGDRDMLATALRNVVLNAIKYTPDGGFVAITARIEGSQVKIEISDSGVGIESEDLPFVFERFYRTDRSRSRETGGTGIGLAVTAEVVKEHDGKIEVRSKPDVGSTFTIILPLQRHP
jgi:signal transduction histidine kinase